MPLPAKDCASSISLSPLEPASSLLSSFFFSFGGASTRLVVLFLLVTLAACTVTLPVASISRARVAVALMSCRLTAPVRPTLPVSSEYAVAEVSSEEVFTAETFTLPAVILPAPPAAASMLAVVFTCTLLIAAVNPAAVLLVANDCAATLSWVSASALTETAPVAFTPAPARMIASVVALIWA